MSRSLRSIMCIAYAPAISPVASALVHVDTKWFACGASGDQP